MNTKHILYSIGAALIILGIIISFSPRATMTVNITKTVLIIVGFLVLISSAFIKKK